MIGMDVYSSRGFFPWRTAVLTITIHAPAAVRTCLISSQETRVKLKFITSLTDSNCLTNHY